MKPSRSRLCAWPHCPCKRGRCEELPIASRLLVFATDRPIMTWLVVITLIAFIVL